MDTATTGGRPDRFELPDPSSHPVPYERQIREWISLNCDLINRGPRGASLCVTPGETRRRRMAPVPPTRVEEELRSAPHQLRRRVRNRGEPCDIDSERRSTFQVDVIGPSVANSQSPALVPVMGQPGQKSPGIRRGYPTYHSFIESRNSCARSSALAGRGESLVTRCCGRVPSTRAGMSASV